MSGPCILAGDCSDSYIQRLRRDVFEKKRGIPKPHGFKLETVCNNPRCIAYEHLQLRAWASWGVKRGGSREDGPMKKEEPGVREFLEHFERDVFPNIKNSNMTVGLLSGGDPDAKMCLEIGASVLLEKPLVMIVARGAYIPLRLRQVADEIVEVDWPKGGDLSQGDLELVRAALDRTSDMLDRKKKKQ